MITLLGEPQSTNSLYKYHCRFGFPTGYMSAKGKQLKEDYQWQAKAQWREAILEKDVAVQIKLYFKNAHKHDIDNYGKILLDSLTGICWVDDSQISQMTVAKFIDKSEPRIEIIIVGK